MTILESKLRELEAVIRTLKRDQEVMAEDKRALTRERDNLALSLNATENQLIVLRQGLSQEREAYSGVRTNQKYTMCLSHLLTSYAPSGCFSRTNVAGQGR